MAGTGNIQGEDQKKLDVIANDILIRILKDNPSVAGLASEEEDTFVAAHPDGRYLVLFDPLDGSSNIDVNISVGTIFSILEKPEGDLETASFCKRPRPSCRRLCFIRPANPTGLDRRTRRFRLYFR